MKLKFSNKMKKSLIEKESKKRYVMVRDNKQKIALVLALAIGLSNLTGCTHSSNTSSLLNEVEVKTQVESADNILLEPSEMYLTSYNRLLYARGASLNEIIKLTSDEKMGISKDGNNADRRLATGEYDGKNIEVTNAAYKEFNQFITSDFPIYVYAEYYNIEEALKQTGATIYTGRHTHLIANIDTEITLDVLIETIETNNKEYLKENPYFTQLSEECIREFAQCILNSLNEKKALLSEDSKKRVYCELGNLKVIGFDSSNLTLNPSGNKINAQYCSDGTVVIDEKEISKLEGDMAKTRTYMHEIEHIYHRVCEDEIQSGYEIVGVSQYWDELAVNPLFWRWYYEAAAESSVMNSTGIQKPLVYKNFVGYLRSLDLIALINPEYKEDALERATINNNPEDLYKIFGVSTLEEKKEIISLMYSIDYLQVEREDLEEEYQKRTGDSIGPSIDVKYRMKKSICTTLAKYFYKNLAERVKNTDVTLEDIFYLINVFEADLNSHIMYDETFDQSKKEENKYFLENYIYIQDRFFDLLSSSSEYSKEEIIQMFNEYAMVIENDGVYDRNARFTWLEDSEKEFIYQMQTQNITCFTTNIRNIYDIESKSYKK